MSDDRRNPYVILGLSHGASSAEAERAFARRSRDARWGDHDQLQDHEVELTDLRWAMAQIERHAAEPMSAQGTYRIPVDSGSLEAPSGPGLLRPAPRPSTRQHLATDPAERERIFDAARLEAAQQLLDRTSVAAGRRLESLSDAPVPVVAIPVLPERQRSSWPIVTVAVAVVVVFAVAGIRSLSSDAADTTVVDAGPTATTVVADLTTDDLTTDDLTTDDVTVAAVDAALAQPTLGDEIVVNGLGITPSDPLDGYGHLCLVFTVDGDVPLGFVTAKVAVISRGIAVAPSPDVTTGRAPTGDVYGDPAPAVREVCLPVERWQEVTSTLVYVSDAGTYRWALNNPNTP